MRYMKGTLVKKQQYMSFLGQDNSLEKEMATHSGILAWKTPQTEEPGGLWGGKESDKTERTQWHTWSSK